MSKYLIDSDVLITAKNSYYAFDLCPGFWHCLLHQHQEGQVHSLDRVRAELMQATPEDEIVQWLGRDVPASFFLSCSSRDVIEAYAEIMLWAQRHSQYFDAAKAKFASGADGWLVAYAQVHGAVVVTNEQPRPNARNEIKLPDVCEQFDVPYRGTFEMLRALGFH